MTRLAGDESDLNHVDRGLLAPLLSDEVHGAIAVSKSISGVSGWEYLGLRFDDGRSWATLQREVVVGISWHQCRHLVGGVLTFLTFAFVGVGGSFVSRSLTPRCRGSGMSGDCAPR